MKRLFEPVILAGLVAALAVVVGISYIGNEPVPVPIEQKDLETTLQELAWGKEQLQRRQARALEQERAGDMDQQINMATVQARMNYCAANMGKDPTCGSPPVSKTGEQKANP